MSLMINLLPDTKQAKLKEHRRRQMVGGVAVLVWVICGVAVVLMLVYMAGQSVVIGNLTRSIHQDESQLQSVSGLTTALTAQEHLASLPGLYGQRVYMTKFFQAYQAADPTDVALSTLQVDDQNNLSVTGTAPTYSEVAKLARALADDNLTVGSGASTGNQPYFTNVNITSVEQATNGVSFTISALVQEAATSGPATASASGNSNAMMGAQ